MSNNLFLTFEQILVIHYDQIERYGGSHGLRDLALLESAIFRPQTTFGNEALYSDIYSKASALMHSLLLNHPFIDGNKRTAVVSCIVFLEINGTSLKISQEELIETALKIESKEWNLERLSSWLKDNSKVDIIKQEKR